jgi:hypothetical protein
VEFEAEQLEPAQNSGVVPDWEKDWKLDAISGVDKTKIECLKSECTPERLLSLNEVMADELRRWDYEIPAQPVVSRRTMVRTKLSSAPFKGRIYRLLRTVADRIRVFLCQFNLKEY